MISENSNKAIKFVQAQPEVVKPQRRHLALIRPTGNLICTSGRVAASYATVYGTTATTYTVIFLFPR